MFKVEKKTLLFVAGVVWFAAGFNIGRIGVIAAGGQWPVWIIALALLIFIVFRKMVFGKLVVKHTARIKGYEGEKHSIFKFFDKQAYLIMAFMMTFGIGLRVSGLVPDWFIAFFYTGLGTALLLAGIEFFIQFVKYHKELKTEAAQTEAPPAQDAAGNAAAGQEEVSGRRTERRRKGAQRRGGFIGRRSSHEKIYKFRIRLFDRGPGRRRVLSGIYQILRL